jgi:hypothetical protein
VVLGGVLGAVDDVLFRRRFGALQALLLTTWRYAIATASAGIKHFLVTLRSSA